MVNATLPTDLYHLTVTPFKKYNLVDTHAPKMYTHNIEIAIHWLPSDYLVATRVVTIAIHDTIIAQIHNLCHIFLDLT